MKTLILYGGLFSALVILLRIAWLFPGAFVANIVRRKIFHQNEPRPPVKGLFIVGWTGMRGVVALAAALALPETLANGSPFPQRNLIIFLTFSVILVTLVLQGLTLPALIRAMGLAGKAGGNSEEIKPRRAMAEAALNQLNKTSEGVEPELATLLDDLRQHY